MKKRVVAWWVVLVLMIGMLPAQAAMVVSVGSVSDTERAVSSVVACMDAAYVLYADGEVGRMDLATRQVEVVGSALGDAQNAAEDGEGEPSRIVSHLFADGNMLYGVDLQSGRWYILLDAQGAFAPVLQDGLLDMSSLLETEEDSAYALDPTSLFAMDGVLYYTVLNYRDTLEYRAGAVDLRSGSNRVFSTKFINELAPWKDGKLLCRIYDRDNAFDLEAGTIKPSEYGFFDPQQDAFEKIGELGGEGIYSGFTSEGLCGDPLTDTMYHIQGSRLVGINMATGESRISAYTGEGMVGMGGNVMCPAYVNGYYVMHTHSGVFSYALDTDAVKNGALRIFGEFGSDAHRSFVKNYPDIPVDVADEYTNSLEELTNAMVSESNAYDVLLLTTSYMPVDRLVEKGYATDLSEFPGIMEIINQMDSRYVEPMRVDGKVYGAPVDMSAYTYAVNMDLWEEIGLSEEDLPTTIAQLYDFLAEWDYEYADDYPDIRLMNMSPMNQMLFSMMLENYISYRQKEGEPLLFDTPEFRSMVEAYERVDFSTLDKQTDEEVINFWGQDALFSYDTSIGRFSMRRWAGSQNTRILPLCITEDVQPVIGANVSVLIINPKTTRQAEAVLYVENYLKNLDKAGANITLFPNHNDPVEASGYQKQKEEQEQELDKQKGLLQSAEESAHAEIKSHIERLEAALEDTEKYRYDASAEDIQDFRQNIDPILWVNEMSVLYSGGADEFSKFFQQYLQGAMPMEQFVKETDKRLKMMNMEDQ